MTSINLIIRWFIAFERTNKTAAATKKHKGLIQTATHTFKMMEMMHSSKYWPF